MRQPRPLGPGSQRSSTGRKPRLEPGAQDAVEPPDLRVGIVERYAGHGGRFAAALLDTEQKVAAGRAKAETSARNSRLSSSRPPTGSRLKSSVRPSRRPAVTSLDGGEGELVDPLRQHGLLRLDFAYGLEHGGQGIFVEGHNTTPLLADQPRSGP